MGVCRLYRGHFSNPNILVDGKEFIITLLTLVLTNNYFRFGESYYFQVCGTTMGANVEDFHMFLNNVFPDIAFTLSFSTGNLQFLDVNINFTGEDLHTELYTEITDCNTLLHFDSWLPKSMIDSLPYSQMLRVKRILDIEIC